MDRQCQRIGEVAGKIYQALGNGSRSMESLENEMHLDDEVLFNQAIGWLCRENKLHFEKSERCVRVTLEAPFVSSGSH